jgi:glycosidase
LNLCQQFSPLCVLLLSNLIAMKKYLLIVLISCSASLSQAQEFMFQGWYWNYPSFIGGGSWIEHLSSLTPGLDSAGFTHIWIPPHAKGATFGASMGYDVKDYYDLGEFGVARWGSREELDDAIDLMNGLEIDVVVDMVYNHREGGAWEDNPAVEGWIENMNGTKIVAGDQPFPSDRFRCYLPLGGDSGNGAGNYYFKIRSASVAGGFIDKPYLVHMATNTVPFDFATDPDTESEPNGGADCGEGNNTITLGIMIDAQIDGGCGTDEFELVLTEDDFNAAGDTLWILLNNTGGGLGNMTDHYIYGLWSGALGADIQDQIGYQTMTDFTNMNSGLGAMNYLNFKPNGNPTQLGGDLDAMLFFYDVDQNVGSTRDVLFENTKWMWQEIGARGFRIDAVKHFPANFMGDLLDYLHDNGIDPPMVVGESYDFSAGVLKGWLDEVQFHMDDDTKAAINIRVFDFSLRFNLEQASDAFGYDVRNVFNSSIVDGAGGSGLNVVTFVNNHDFRDPGQPVDNNPELGYAYILTNNKLGVPCVYHTDYFAPNNLKYQIDGLMEAHRRYIFGASQVDYLNRFGTPYASNYIAGFPNTTLLYQLSNAESGREVVVVINYAGETLRLDHTINTANIFPGDTLTDIFSVSPYDFVTVNGSNQVYFEIPARSFAVFVEGDLRDELIDISTPVGNSVNQIERSVRCYPNPATDWVILEWDTEEALSVQVTDIQGRNVPITAMQTGNRLLLDTRSLTPGMYFLAGPDGWNGQFIKQ